MDEKRYYYTPHAALYMHLEHGFTFESVEGRPLYPTQWPQANIPHYLSNQTETAIIAQSGDLLLGVAPKDGIALFTAVMRVMEGERRDPVTNKLQTQWEEMWYEPRSGGGKMQKTLINYVIIKRNGKDFIWPQEGK